MTCYKGAVPLGHASFSLCVKVRDLHEVMFRLPSVYKLIAVLGLPHLMASAMPCWQKFELFSFWSSKGYSQSTSGGADWN